MRWRKKTKKCGFASLPSCVVHLPCQRKRLQSNQPNHTVPQQRRERYTRLDSHLHGLECTCCDRSISTTFPLPPVSMYAHPGTSCVAPDLKRQRGNNASNSICRRERGTEPSVHVRRPLKTSRINRKQHRKETKKTQPPQHNNTDLGAETVAPLAVSRWREPRNQRGHPKHTRAHTPVHTTSTVQHQHRSSRITPYLSPSRRSGTIGSGCAHVVIDPNRGLELAGEHHPAQPDGRIDHHQQQQGYAQEAVALHGVPKHLCKTRGQERRQTGQRYTTDALTVPSLFWLLVVLLRRLLPLFKTWAPVVMTYLDIQLATREKTNTPHQSNKTPRKSAKKLTRSTRQPNELLSNFPGQLGCAYLRYFGEGPPAG